MVGKFQILVLSGVFMTWACSPESGTKQQAARSGGSDSTVWGEDKDAKDEDDKDDKKKKVRVEDKKDDKDDKKDDKDKDDKKDDKDKNDKDNDQKDDKDVVRDEDKGDGGAPQIAGLVAMEANLADEKEQSGSVMLPDDYAGGNLQLSVVRTDLDSLDDSGTITVTVEPAMVQATAGENVEFTLKITTTSMAPSFAAGGEAHFEVVATDVDSQQVVAMADVPLEVKADLIVQMMGGDSPETWSSEEELSVRPHEGGLRIRFVNMDPNSTHVVHGQGAINHGDIGNPLAMGDEYEQTIMPTDGQDTAVYYCHNHESGGEQRRINVNVEP